MHEHPFAQPPHGVHASVSTQSVDGVLLDALTRGAYAVITPDGQVREHEHDAWASIGDGSLQRDLRNTVRCDVCAADAVQLATQGAVSAAQAILLARHQSSHIRASDLSGVGLCARHQTYVTMPDGVVVVVSPVEAKEITKRLNPFVHWLRRLFWAD